MLGKVLIVFAFMVFAESANIPSYIHTCKRSDPKVSKCVMEAVESLRPKLRSGIPELDVPSMEPLRISNIKVTRDLGASHFNLELNNVDVFGTSDFHLSNLKLDVPNHTYKISISFPRIQLIGDYVVDAQLLAFPVKGDGRFNANATKCEAIGILKGDIIETGGEQRMHFTDLTINLTIGDYNLHLDNLFANDQVLTDGINNMLNQNKKDLLQLANPYIQTKASEYLLDVANKIVKNFSYEEVFPEN
ncbi:PREDICTED: uncharacterized protein LOC108565843 [Nicrophorus vespilloides]|uniref:Uncharacterized protein LOC108565843 n=1 Tax=Nicrophorus vespilloides TaxID=110193 RepID=A0ABM1N2D1_NICVS|nr:PREDICTED: uncharacterized protein LOC108565843 [Nicrophorus vespilloides]